jgi:hypothetical protein
MRGFVVLLVLLFLFVGLVEARVASNYTGYTDSISITGVGADSLKYGPILKYSKYEGLSVWMAVKDTAVTGYKEDSSRVAWGFQPLIFHKVGGVVDTLFGPRFLADTCDTGSLMHVVSQSIIAADWDDITGTYGLCDTSLSTVGRKIQVRDVPTGRPWQYFRIWVQGLTGCRVNLATNGLLIRAVVGKRLFDIVSEYKD